MDTMAMMKSMDMGEMTMDMDAMQECMQSLNACAMAAAMCAGSDMMHGAEMARAAPCARTWSRWRRRRCT